MRYPPSRSRRTSCFKRCFLSTLRITLLTCTACLERWTHNTNNFRTFIPIRASPEFGAMMRPALSMVAEPGSEGPRRRRAQHVEQRARTRDYVDQRATDHLGRARTGCRTRRPVHSKPRATPGGSPALAATVVVTNLAAGRGCLRLRAPALSDQVEAIVVHDLGPRGCEVTRELLLRVVLCVDLRERSKLGVVTEDEVDGGTGPLDLARRAIATLVHVRIRGGGLPLGAHVEQVHEEVVGQRPGPVGEHAVLGLPEVGVQGAHAADEHGH